MAGQLSWISTFVLLSSMQYLVFGSTNYKIGAGIYDVTGPAAEINMMGYAEMEQRSSGIHMRQFSRAFVIADANEANRVVFVSVDVGMMSQIVKKAVISGVQQKYGSLYSDENVLLSSTHTHSGPAGYMQYVLFGVTSFGFVRESYDALVEGIIKSIEEAHNNLAPGNIYINKGDLLNANINRNPLSYLENPATERNRYSYDVDKEMTVLKLADAQGNGIGMINWFPVHCTSMQKSNGLISSDNKGYASLLFEAEMNPGNFPGEGSFVAAFGQANEGDVSPNLDGPKCTDTGEVCNTETSTCNGESKKCVASGPGQDMFESTKIIGQRQFDKALELYKNANVKLEGPIDFRLQYVDMTSEEVNIDGTTVTTCKPAMGYSFAAGSTDGPGGFPFSQGDTSGNAFWDAIRNVISTPSQEMVDCHSPKPILLPTGQMTFPYKWQPDIVDIQILRLGQLFIVGVPGEFTTMAGRRLREKVSQSLTSNGFTTTPEVVIAGLSNSYADYMTTYEEYQIQRYEGASTIYGPHTLSAFLQRYENLAESFMTGATVDQGPSPPDLLNQQWSFVTGVVLDTAPWFKSFGDQLQKPNYSYGKGQRVTVKFVTGHPRNNRKTGSTYLKVEQKQSDGSWKTIAKDSAWETQYHWKRVLISQSTATIYWDIPTNQASGTYRIRHFGNRKNVFGVVKSFTGKSRSFQVY